MTHAFENAADALAFITGGNATLTLDFEKTGRSFTLKIRKPWDHDNHRRDHDAKVFFANELTGDPNADEFNHQVGFFFEDSLRLMQSKKARALGEDKRDAFKALEWVLARLTKGVLPEGVVIGHSGNCARCGREITTLESRARGVGPECAKHF